MHTKLFTLTLSLVCTAATANEVRRPELTINTNSYSNVTITKRTPVDAVMRYDGGIAEVKIFDLPDESGAMAGRDAAEDAREAEGVRLYGKVDSSEQQTRIPDCHADPRLAK